MASYLLLRNNKESGPFTVDELVNFGLKPYDLVWVQGKSAAWRYPSEIDELKPFAPAVEEQPFDRFYKRSTDDEKKDVSHTAIEEKYSQYIPPPKAQPVKHTPARSVFVTLPGNKQVALNDVPVQKTETHTPPPAPTPTISITENPAAAEIKYSQPLDEIKEMYVKTLLERKDKRARKGIAVSMLKKVAVVAGLVTIGVLAGMLIRSKPGSAGSSQDLPKLMDASTAITNKTQEELVTAENETAIQEDQSNTNTRQPASVDVEKISEESAPENTEPTVKIRKETMIIVPKRKENYERQPNPGVLVNSVTGERDRRLRNLDEIAGENSESFTSAKSSSSLKDLVTVASNDYKRVAFGGIRNLYLTVTNDSKFTLDDVVVELQYLKPSEEPLRTENITFKSIAPNGSATIRVPDTNRGIKVTYRIINIRSRQSAQFALGDQLK